MSDNLPTIITALRARDNVREVKRLQKLAVDAVLTAKFPKERWSCGLDESGVRLTLQRQRHWIADAVKQALKGGERHD